MLPFHTWTGISKFLTYLKGSEKARMPLSGSRWGWQPWDMSCCAWPLQHNPLQKAAGCVNHRAAEELKQNRNQTTGSVNHGQSTMGHNRTIPFISNCLMVAPGSRRQKSQKHRSKQVCEYLRTRRHQCMSPLNLLYVWHGMHMHKMEQDAFYRCAKISLSTKGDGGSSLNIPFTLPF